MNRFYDLANLGGVAPTSVAVGVSTTAVSIANPRRVFEIITNISDTTIYVAFGNAAIASKGIQLLPGQSFIYGLYTECPWTGTVNAICASTNKTLAIQTINKTENL